MRIQIISDTHLEFHPDGGRAFIDRLDPSGVDVLVAAGDIASCSGLHAALCLLAERYPHVVYVPGNHEYYGHAPSDVTKVQALVEASLPTVHWLSRSNATIDGVRFIGTTMWFPDTAYAQMQAHGWSDFRHIRGLNPWVYEENFSSVAYLGENLSKTDIVVTHHLPTYQSVPERYMSSLSNCFFVCDMQKLIVERQPKLWIHGHTHDSCDYLIGDTRIVCNPYGYDGRISMLNESFDNKKVVEI